MRPKRTLAVPPPWQYNSRMDTWDRCHQESLARDRRVAYMRGVLHGMFLAIVAVLCFAGAVFVVGQ